MKENKIMKTLLGVMVAVGCALCMGTLVTNAKEQPTIRVGYMDYHGFIDEQTDGSYTGYGAEYLTKIAEYTDFHYEYVYGEWTDLLEQLKAGEIDLLCTAQYTKERADIYD